jgi:hypothetical protein
MESVNCLTRALDQWDSNRDIFRLFYNSNHVIALENWYNKKEPVKHLKAGPNYLPLDMYGFNFFASCFSLPKKHQKLLVEYFDYINFKELKYEFKKS